MPCLRNAESASPTLPKIARKKAKTGPLRAQRINTNETRNRCGHGSTAKWATRRPFAHVIVLHSLVYRLTRVRVKLFASLNPMPSFDECLILLPSSTLEDFPSDASAADARNLLAAWTVLWHPSLIAATRQNPTWYRADSPPEPRENQLVVVPTLSLSRLPESYKSRLQATEGSVWLGGETRAEMLKALELKALELEALGSAFSGQDNPDTSTAVNALVHAGRSIGPEDFFAFGYAILQIQVMTRRLRYTSNLDEIQVQKRVVAAAEAFVSGDAAKAIESLHEAFDSVAEERDHYFSTDPALVDMTLLTPATLPILLAESSLSVSLRPSSTEETSSLVPTASELSKPGELSSGRLATPVNVLIDDDVIAAIKENGANPATQNLLDQLRRGHIGWAAGGPGSNVVFDTLTYRDCQQQLERAYDAAKEAIGIAPKVYARLAGSTPADLTRSLVALGYVGMTPIDFTGGTGFGDESKVMRREGGAEIESLTARPIDANNDASFLALAPRLGEMIDAGEVATGLLAHWPGNVCDSYRDLRRVASWSLALGRFWSLESYFTQGEHPYHHSNGSTQSLEAAERLVDGVVGQMPDPISRIVKQTRQSITELRDELLQGMLALASGKPGSSSIPSTDLARALGAEPVESGSAKSGAGAAIVLNPYASAQRLNVRISGEAIAEKHIYGVSREHGQTIVTLDVPASGFASIRASTSSSDAKTASSSPSWLSSLLRSGPKRIADSNSLRNEFMEVMIDTKSGGIQGVYSGLVRGNRFSMRLVLGDRETTSRCDKVRVLESQSSTGSIETSGTILDENQTTLATFTLVFTLVRGSRVLSVSGEIKPSSTLALGSNPWKDYIAARVAISSDTGTTRAIVRDKLHRTSGRRLVAPLGIVTDETERQTLIASAGLAYHRRVEDRFVDTLLLVAGETSQHFDLHYGFDVTQPIEVAKSLIAPAVVLGIGNTANTTTSGWPSRGWLLHTSPKDVSVISIQSFQRSDSKLAIVLRLIRTRSTGGNTTLRFCRNVLRATVWTPELANSSDHSAWDMPLESRTLESPESEHESESTDTATASSSAGTSASILSATDKRFSLSYDGDTVKATLSGHQILELLVILA